MSCRDCAGKSRQPGSSPASSRGMVQTTPRGGLPSTPRTGLALRPRAEVLLKEPCDSSLPVGQFNSYGVPGCAPGNAWQTTGDVQTNAAQDGSTYTKGGEGEHPAAFPDADLPASLKPLSAGVVAAGFALLFLLTRKKEKKA